MEGAEAAPLHHGPPAGRGEASVLDSNQSEAGVLTFVQSQVMEHDTAVLECAVTNIDTAVTVRERTLVYNPLKRFLSQVSWLRWSDMSVLTVGALVFSSDPRLLVTMTQLSPSTVSWKLYISRCEGS